MSSDVIVVGGGPVGLATALYAVRRGLVPLVLEPRLGAVDKACGEGLMPGGLAALHDLGVDPAGHDLRGIRYLAKGRVAEADFAAGPGRGVRRTTLHSALRSAVDAAGIEVLASRAVALRQDADGVTVHVPPERTGAGAGGLRASWVIGADGLHSRTRRWAGLDRAAGPARVVGPARFGLRRHFRVHPWSDHVEVYWAAHGEAYVTPVSDDVVGVAVLSRHTLPLDEALAAFPELCERLRGATADTAVRGAGPLRQRTSGRVSGRVLLVGDASGYVDALTGEGISLGLAQARAAVDAVVSGRPRAYERAWRVGGRRYSLLTHGLVQATRPRWARRLLVPAAASMPAVFDFAVKQLSTGEVGVAPATPSKGTTVLESSRAFSGFAVADVAAARTFYAETLGLRVTESNGMLRLHLAGDHAVLVYPKPDHTPATFTILNFPVADIEEAVDALTAAGVVFETYEGTPAATDPKGIFRGGGPLIAWFTDPSGNVLSVIESDGHGSD